MKLTKYILHVSILIHSLCSETYAQNTFVKYLRYGNPESNCQGWSVLEAPNGNIICQFRYLDHFSLGLDFGFFTLNKYGDSLSTNVYHLLGDDYIERSLLYGNNIIYGTGARMNTGASFYDGILYKIDLLDSNNNQYHYYSNPHGSTIYSGIIKNENSLFLTGRKRGDTTLNNFNVNKVGLNGITQFDSSYIAPRSDFALSSTFDNDKNIVLSGGSYSGSPREARVMAMKVDTNGNELWRKFIGISGDIDFECRSIGSGIVQASNGNYYISGSTDNWCDNNIYSKGKSHSLLICLDSNANYKWTKKEKFENYNQQYYSNIFKTLDGNIVCVGNITTILDTVTLKENDDLLITKYDLNGNIIWYRVYGNVDYYEFLYNSSQTKDGGYLLTGRYENIDIPFNDVRAFVLKLDDCGCLVPNCDPNCIATGIAETKKPFEIKIYPNPANSTLFVSGLNHFDYEIYDRIGKLVLKGKASETGIDISSLETGMYLLKTNKGVSKFLVE